MLEAAATQGPLSQRQKAMLAEISAAVGEDSIPPSLRQFIGDVQPLGLARRPDNTIIGSYRLNPELDAAFTAALAVPDDKDFGAMIEAPLPTSDPEAESVEGGKRRQHGGAEDWTQWWSAKIAFTKSMTLMATVSAKNIGVLALEWAKTQGAGLAARPEPEIVKNYLLRELTPLGAVGMKAGTIITRLVEQFFLKTPVSILMLTVATAGALANFVRFILQKSNEWARASSDLLLSDERAEAAAAAALESVKSVGTTIAVGAFVANQVGALPMSAILAAILFTLQVNLGTGGGRAYLVSGFYAWYKSQSEPERQAFKAAAIQYGAAAKDAAKSTAEEAKVKVADAAAALGPLLAKARRGGKNAFQSVAAAVAKATRKEAPAAPQGDAAAQAALTDGGPAAAIAAGAEGGTGAASGGRRKTRKQSVKRRVTRRRKAQKVLGTPVFIY